MLNAWGLHQVRLVWFVCVALLWAQVLPGQTPLTLAGPIRNATNGHDYYLLEPATWRNSEAAAVQLGGHLVTINSQEENLWIQETFSNFQSVKGDLWIGLMNPQVWTGPSDEAQWFNEFQWCSGQASVFRWWASGETAPTNGIRSGYCKMWGPSNLFERGQWAEEDPAASLNGVVEVVSQLEIVSSPQDVTTAIGGTVELNVVADGPAPIYYQWQFGGTNLPGATQPLLQLTNVRAAQAGAYVVVVSNAASQLVSAPATLTVSTLLMWGCYAHGETNVPADIGSLIAISGGDEFSLGLRADGTVVGWGQDLYGDVEIPAFLRDVVAIEAGGLHAVALRSDGTLVCWGAYGFGATTPPPGLSGVAAIAAGSGHTLALKTNGTVISWGLNTGGGPPFEITNAVAVSSGGWQDLVLASDGQVVSWPFAAGQEAIAKVPPDLNNVVAISAGIDHSLALKADGKVVAWGNNNWGQINVPPGLSEVVAIAAGGYHSLALTADGKIVAWGSNPGGFPLAPPPVPNVNTIAAGYDHDLLLVGDGSPRITVQPWDRTVSCGASVCLAAKVVGAAPLTFQWRFNGVDIAGATSDSYLIGSSDLTNSGVYALSISNAFGKVETRGSLLVVTSNIYHPNQAPVLPSVSEVTIEQFNELSVTNAAVDPDGPASALSYRLLSAPAGMSIDGSGVIRWTPGPGQAPSTNIVITIVTDAGMPPTS
ncbi:MAG TPA: immunoglobulin domain-containing protein, partial [Verrucomicrobiae bacterium]|nr:immunoglobulin domain-containing protein [Verrucomicrobiae bacterium]